MNPPDELMNPADAEELQIRLGGSGGQGLQLCAALLTHALALEGKHVAQSQSYEPTSRGGISRSDIVVGDKTPDYPLVTYLDLLLLLDHLALKPSLPLLLSLIHNTEPTRRGQLTRMPSSA